MRGKYGFIDCKGELIIKPIFQWADRFYNGIAAICENEKYGCIDKNGNIIIPTMFEDVDIMSEGLIAAQIGEKWGYIDCYR